MDTNTTYTAGSIYPLTVPHWLEITRQMGLGAMLITGQPDYSRGRRCVKADQYAADWEIWTTTGHKVSVSISTGPGPERAYFLASCSNDPDDDRPKPQFAIPDLPGQKPQKCIHPHCTRLVVASGPATDEAVANYRNTGACQKGHNGYYCEKCKRPHSYASQLGKNHYAYADQQAEAAKLAALATGRAVSGGRS